MPVLPEPRLLLGPGPSPVHPRVLTAMARPPIGYLDPELFGILAQIQSGLRMLFRTANAFTLAVTGTGMAGMEFCLSNLIEPGETVVIGVNGFFGGRMCEIAARQGANVVRVDHPWGTAVDPTRMAQACANAGKVALVGCVHAETSTGVESDCAAIAQVARDHGALFVMDAVTSLGGIPVEVDAWEVDAAYSATQKCIGTPPGLAPVTLSERAWEKAKNRTAPLPTWFFDARLLDAYWDARPAAYHHTVPVNNYYGLLEALRLIEEEGLRTRWERHQSNSRLLWEHLGRIAPDLTPLAPADHRLPTLNAVLLPDRLASQDAELRSRLLTGFGIEIGGGFGDLKGRLWRIGLMGHGSDARHVHALIGALDTLLRT
ncbi:MAG: alanine--glyoxylate aminotransferase family protein [Capsulimonadales bacterium]|nr:alanine--glyoxylate aminotransferase family protein [Capsulimonadales bacterium]